MISLITVNSWSPLFVPALLTAFTTTMRSFVQYDLCSWKHFVQFPQFESSHSSQFLYISVMIALIFDSCLMTCDGSLSIVSPSYEFKLVQEPAVVTATLSIPFFYFKKTIIYYLQQLKSQNGGILYDWTNIQCTKLLESESTGKLLCAHEHGQRRVM